LVCNLRMARRLVLEGNELQVKRLRKVAPVVPPALQSSFPAGTAEAAYQRPMREDGIEPTAFQESQPCVF
jgi:hypothetical protein